MSRFSAFSFAHAQASRSGTSEKFVLPIKPLTQSVARIGVAFQAIIWETHGQNSDSAQEGYDVVIK